MAKIMQADVFSQAAQPQNSKKGEPTNQGSMPAEAGRDQCKIDLSALAVTWKAPFVERAKLIEFSGGAIHPRTMANLDSQGKGIESRITIGKKIIYPVQDVIAWLEKRASRPGKGVIGSKAVARC